jgi:hypothetical protein
MAFSCSAIAAPDRKAELVVDSELVGISPVGVVVVVALISDAIS